LLAGLKEFAPSGAKLAKPYLPKGQGKTKKNKLGKTQEQQ